MAGPAKQCCANPKIESVPGGATCTSCGAVHDESNIVSEISFGESASGAATVNGGFVAAGQRYAKTGGPFQGGGSEESREAALWQAKGEINRLAASLRIPETIAETADRWFKLALTHNFLKGRKIAYVVAVCLYISCKKEKQPHMLIDFSDMLRINVFVLGQTYLKFLRVTNTTWDVILDPSIYLQRFARHLNFGTDAGKIVMDATRLVKRMDRDWIVQGRRPAGICGAALVLAAHMNGHKRNIRDVVYVVRVADVTIQKRLEEFKETASSQLTVDEFRNVWLEQAHDPPCFGPKKVTGKKGKAIKASKAKNGKKRKATNDEDEIDESEEVEETSGEPALPTPPSTQSSDIPIDPALLAATPSEAVKETTAEVQDGAPPTPENTQKVPTPVDPEQAEIAAKEKELLRKVTAAFDSDLGEEIQNNINSALGSDGSETALSKEIQEALTMARQRDSERQEREKATEKENPFDLGDVDDDFDVKNALLSVKESESKEEMWMEANREYLEEQEAKIRKREMDEKNGVVKPRKKRIRKEKIVDDAPPASPADSAKQMLIRKGFSTKINYKALDHLFDD
ncbi:cyclin-like protein [Ascobolus immersus RN42]|uniref:B-related factor 1 n=1 Tax=Ascobolus immersus RN42 TaxID=1160509 RepID=A0A3N4IJZ0_ASCIM|nr:cyclin-like protein [Ascobolus immersus RN42]